MDAHAEYLVECDVLALTRPDLSESERQLVALIRVQNRFIARLTACVQESDATIERLMQPHHN